MSTYTVRGAEGNEAEIVNLFGDVYEMRIPGEDTVSFDLDVDDADYARFMAVAFTLWADFLDAGGPDNDD